MIHSTIINSDYSNRLSYQQLYLPNIDLFLPYVENIVLLLGECFSRMWGFTWKISNDRILWSHYKRSKGSHFVDRGFG